MNDLKQALCCTAIKSPRTRQRKPETFLEAYPLRQVAARFYVGRTLGCDRDRRSVGCPTASCRSIDEGGSSSRYPMKKFHPWVAYVALALSFALFGATLHAEDQKSDLKDELPRIAPSALDLRPESGGGQHGMSFDRWGQKFNCHNSDHLQAVIIDDRYLARNPYYALASARESIAVDGPQAEVYRISPVEPWRIVRTRLRVSGETPGLIEGGGRAAGYFTSATGITIYNGDAWPEKYRNEVYAIIGDVGSNLVHRKTSKPRRRDLQRGSYRRSA